jgi:hypothetical protein
MAATAMSLICASSQDWPSDPEEDVARVLLGRGITLPGAEQF